MDNSFELRKITPEDWGAYKDFRLGALQSEDALAFGSSYNNEKDRTEEDWRGRLKDNPERFFLGAFSDGMMVSGGGVYFNKERNEWIIVGIYTRPEYRRRGLSQKIIEAILDQLNSRDIEKVALMVNTKQDSAVGLYQKLGFKIIDTIKDYPMGDGQLHDEYIMEKTLL
jgi:ribosomal protein S18 acetylase RimI-like enzyme